MPACGASAPPSIALTSTGEKKTLVTFGVYVDFLSEETLEAYACALKPDGGIDGVVLSQSNAQNPEVGGKFAILYQGDPNSPTVRNLAVPTRDLMQAPEQSLQQIEAAQASIPTQLGGVSLSTKLGFSWSAPLPNSCRIAAGFFAS